MRSYSGTRAALSSRSAIRGKRSPPSSRVSEPENLISSFARCELGSTQVPFQVAKDALLAVNRAECDPLEQGPQSPRLFDPCIIARVAPVQLVLRVVHRR